VAGYIFCEAELRFLLLFLEKEELNYIISLETTPYRLHRVLANPMFSAKQNKRFLLLFLEKEEHHKYVSSRLKKPMAQFQGNCRSETNIPKPGRWHSCYMQLRQGQIVVGTKQCRCRYRACLISHVGQVTACTHSNVEPPRLFG
jgi:hypothetical protein